MQVTAYLGQLQEEAAGFKVDPADRVEQPEEMYWYHIQEASGLPLVAGGIQDQPYEAFMTNLVVKKGNRRL